LDSQQSPFRWLGCPVGRPWFIWVICWYGVCDCRVDSGFLLRVGVCTD